MQVAVVDSICKDQDVSVLEQLRVVLTAHFVILVLPCDLVCRRIDDEQQVQVL